MVYSRAERVFIFEHYFASESSATVREAFSNAYPDIELPNKTTVHRLVITFRDTGSVSLWQVLIERQNTWNYGRTDFKQCISCNNGIWLQEFNIAIGFVVLCVNGFMSSCWGCVLNGTICVQVHWNFECFSYTKECKSTCLTDFIFFLLLLILVDICCGFLVQKVQPCKVKKFWCWREKLSYFI
jgi:hypothetical protein